MSSRLTEVSFAEMFQKLIGKLERLLGKNIHAQIIVLGKLKDGSRPRKCEVGITKMSENQEKGKQGLTLVYLDGNGNSFCKGRVFHLC